MSFTSADKSQTIYVGIDVQVQRPCAVVALDGRCRMLFSGWLSRGESDSICDDLVGQVELAVGKSVTWHFGIDAPRQPLAEKRRWFWDRKAVNWRARRTGERGWGRHSEVIIRSCGIANPQWTPTASEAPEWMELGFTLFRGLEQRGYRVSEVFPSASYSLLAGDRHQPVTLDFSSFAGGPKDMLDAAVAAFSLHEFLNGRGQEVGDDGLGTIVLPRPLPEGTLLELLCWPEAS